MPIPAEYSDIINMLFQATKDCRVAWIEKDGTFIVQLPEYNLELWNGTDDNEKAFVAVGLKDPKGRKFFDNWYVEDGDNDFIKLHEFIGVIRRQVRRIPQKLDELRKLLESSETIGISSDSELS